MTIAGRRGASKGAPPDGRPAGQADIEPGDQFTMVTDGPAMYRTFRDKEDGCIKVVLKP